MEHVAETRPTATTVHRVAARRAREAADAVDPELPIRDQWQHARAFFRDAETAIEALDQS